MPDVRLPELSLAGRVGVSYVDAPMNYLADLSVKPVTYNPPPGTGLPRRVGNYQNFVVRIHNARPYADDLSLDRQAFILTTHDTQVRDFYDEQELKTTYYREIEELIKRETGEDVFVHHTAIVNQSGYRTLNEGERVEFDVKQGPKGLQAENVRRLEQQAAS